MDIQPGYEKYFPFKLHKFIDFLNKSIPLYSRVILLFNGPDLGMEDEETIRSWLLENELNEELIDSI